jgi:hypothetical protein
MNVIAGIIIGVISKPWSTTLEELGSPIKGVVKRKNTPPSTLTVFFDDITTSLLPIRVRDFDFFG